MLEKIATFAPPETRERVLKWMGFIEEDLDPWPFGGALHGENHWGRVLALGQVIGAREGFAPGDLDALAAAAAFHDTRRHDAFLDHGHGDRAADYYRAYCAETGLPFDERAFLAIKWHDRDDAAGEATAGTWDAAHPVPEGCRATAQELLRAFKDADGLDRVRMGSWALDAKYLRTEAARSMTGLAHDLLTASQLPDAVYPYDQESVQAERRPLPEAEPLPYLVVVDVQNDFVDGALGTPEAQKALPRMVEEARGFKGRVVFTKDTHTAFYDRCQEGRKLPVAHCMAGGKGWQLAGGMRALKEELDAPVFLKGMFGSTDLAAQIAAAHARGKVASVELIGLCTDICVVSNALLLRAELPNLPLSVKASCCAGVTPAAHEAALATLKSCQVDVL